ncbi:hypothetical protein B0F90DRAFT_1717898 [Multifurca ochricompacta]|uniref:Secreted protein n=1 Tax=Multifurca ochricompacta TaxID=376703 RepID=A0AAD4M4U7_9AGAM|nr:hypothetical protein B0F90DRAFT_1717898 [Multifurca ochricompacta]
MNLILLLFFLKVCLGARHRSVTCSCFSHPLTSLRLVRCYLESLTSHAPKKYPFWIYCRLYVRCALLHILR